MAKRVAQATTVTGFLSLSALVIAEMVQESREAKRNAPPPWTDKNRWRHGE